jgi:hypothetical protein
LIRPVQPYTHPRIRPSTTVTGLSWLIAALALPAAAVGLFWRSGDGIFAVVTARGETVELYGRGLYHYDSLFTAGAAHGTDAVVILVGGPLLVLTTLVRRRAAPRVDLLHTGTLLFFLYVYGSASLGTVAFNPMFPSDVAIFSVSLFAVVVAVASVDRTVLAGPLPRRGPATFLFVSAAVTLLVWGGPMLAALISGAAPDRLDAATTDVTFALDVGIIVPTAAVAGALILRRAPVGYLIAVPLLVLEVMLAPMITA